ncbi:hypothetical protein ABZP36_035985 [Zizania latifolia]
MARFPVLVHHRYAGNLQTLFSISDHSSRSVSIPEMNSTYYPTAHGWILVLNPGDAVQTFLWNPQDGARVELPDMDEQGDELQGTIWAGDGWVKYEYDIGTRTILDEDDNFDEVEEKRMFDAVTSVKGKFYYWHSSSMVGTFEFTDDVVGDDSNDEDIEDEEGSDDGGDILVEHISDQDGSNDDDGEYSRDNADGGLRMKIDMIDINIVEYTETNGLYTVVFMVEASGELYQVYIFFIVSDMKKPTRIAVYRLDSLSSPQATWHKTDDIGDRVFLLGTLMSSSCPAGEHDLRRNTVYWVNPRHDHDCLYIFDLEDGSYTMVQPCQGTPALGTTFFPF